MALYILYSGILISILIRVFFVLHGSDVADVQLLHQMGASVLQGNNPYLSLNFNAYPPLGIYLEAATLYLSNLLNIPFHILTKILPNIADIIISLILYKFLIKQKVKPINASFWSLIFILNPISIIISSIHGQIDAIPSFFVLLTIYLLTFKSSGFYLYIAFALQGLAIAIKPNPIILLPIFLLFGNTTLKQKIIFLLLAIAPVTITILPYAVENLKQILGNLFTYSGVYDFGYSAIFRGLWYQKNANFWLPLTEEFLDASKYLFLAGLLFLTVLFAKSKSLTKACLAIYLLFLSIYFGIAAQYLSWILPLAILERDLLTIPFSITGLVALLGFYLFFGPDILFGSLTKILTFQSKFMPIYVIGNLLLWIVILWWLTKIVRKYIQLNIEIFSQNRRRLIKYGVILFIILLLPILRLTVSMISQLL